MLVPGVGGLNLGSSVETVHNPVDVVEHALSKGAAMVLMPVTARRSLVDLSDDAATKVQVLFYADAADALEPDSSLLNGFFDSRIG